MKYTAAGNIEGEEQWVIQTKFETPILNFIDSAGASSTEIADISNNQGGKTARPYGMWHQYGRLPSGSEGISLEIMDVGSYASLADIVGFKKTSEKLGKVATSKTISEAVVAVPFIEVENSRQFFDVAVGDAMGDSVSKMVESMGRYVFPPSMDFVKYPEEVNPFAMYIFEFEHELNQQDLVDIWQNLPPRIGRAFDTTAPLDSSEIMQEKQITHSLSCGELLENADAKLQWMIFKVKQKAQTNYWRKTVTNNTSIVPLSDIVDNGGVSSLLSSATIKSSSDFIAGGAGQGAVEKTGEFDRTYNWPYDFFSLVELVKIDEEVKFDIESKEEK